MLDFGGIFGFGRRVTSATLLSYAQGFTEVAIARNWTPAHRQEREPWEDEPPLDWTFLRLAALCRLFIEAQGRQPLAR